MTPKLYHRAHVYFSKIFSSFTQNNNLILIAWSFGPKLLLVIGNTFKNTKAHITNPCHFCLPGSDFYAIKINAYNWKTIFN